MLISSWYTINGTAAGPRTVRSSSNQFFIENCVALTILLHELCEVTSSFLRTAWTAQFLSKNRRAEACGASTFYDPRVPPVTEVKPVPPVPVTIVTKDLPPAPHPLNLYQTCPTLVSKLAVPAIPP